VQADAQEQAVHRAVLREAGVAAGGSTATCTMHAVPMQSCALTCIVDSMHLCMYMHTAGSWLSQQCPICRSATTLNFMTSTRCRAARCTPIHTPGAVQQPRHPSMPGYWAASSI
jgi:hypothetical protein